jgi:hypothetical protein
MIIHRGLEETIIEDELVASTSKVKCIIGKTGSDSLDAKFELHIEEGVQVFEGCHLRMAGPMERDDFLKFLKQIVIEIELLDK